MKIAVARGAEQQVAGVGKVTSFCVSPGKAFGLAVALAASSMALSASVGRWLPPSWRDISSEARIFLVAGARDSANFAQEIVDQKKYWLSRGYAPNQIECFFATPEPAQVDDAEQFRSLAGDLEDCHLASPQVVYGAISRVASNYPHSTFYLYVTSHGTGPLLDQALSPDLLRSPGAAWLAGAIEEARIDRESDAFKWFSPYRIELEGAGSPYQWGWASFPTRYTDLRIRKRATAEESLFTPRYLAQALGRLPASVRKIVVLQACHSGGFILPPDQAPAPEETLVSVENIAVLTSARADRTSFGCDAGSHTTYYGGAFQEALESSVVTDAFAQDWRMVHEKVAGKVEKLEAGQQIAADRRSLPQYFSNLPRQR